LFLLDTDVVSNFRKRKPHPNLLDWFESVPPDEVAVSVMTAFEIQAGASLLRPTNPVKADEIEAWLDGFVLTGAFVLLPLDAEVARVYGRMFVTPSLKNFVMPDLRSKRPKSGVDLMLAATAIVHGTTVVTINKYDFLRIHEAFPLPSLYEPFSKEWLVGQPEHRHGM
jgi:predicted nucleic acid-binding protein